MENASYIALSRQISLNRALSTTANNIANANTTGFRSQEPLFTEYLAKSNEGETISMVNDIGMRTNTDSGHITITGRRLDVAISGPAYFGVQSPDGGNLFTRNGGFGLNNEGTLIDVNGYPILSPGKAPINIPRDTGQISISGDGIITDENGELGRIGLFEFDNYQELQIIGNGLHKSEATPFAAEESSVQSGAIEGSNVEPVREISNMIDIMRAFQSAQKILQNEHERQQNAIRKIMAVA